MTQLPDNIRLHLELMRARYDNYTHSQTGEWILLDTQDEIFADIDELFGIVYALLDKMDELESEVKHDETN